ncbi:SIMPL domain-containing protein [Tepidamorphus sp. 3E244]|uniref:SIMPL domain-containing protein n=1 Tax=Tepidamorphus sp. 3E244 TaxID=3385498 RepID=UPI0038FCD993
MHFNVMLRAGLVAALVALLALAWLPARAQAADDRALITMTGTGTVNASPDMAIVTSGTVSEAKTAREALSANNAAMQKVIETLKEAGIEARDIQTSDFNVSPVYVHHRANPGETSRPPEVSGYRVSNNVTVRVRDLAGLGPVLDKLVSEGANSINGIQFTIDDDEALLAEARKRAVAAARAKAETIAQAANVRLGPIAAIVENEQAGQPIPMMRMARAEAAMDSSVPIETGEQTMRVDVSISWEIVQ